MARAKFNPLQESGFGLDVAVVNVFLKTKFIIPPFSVLDTKSGDWQQRKRAWLDIGLDSELGRGARVSDGEDAEGEALLFKSQNGLNKLMAERTGKPAKGFSTGTSIFDPVLCELCYEWFCPVGGLILDPFSGGSVRGIVASMTGRKYIGVDLRPEQIDANRSQWDKIKRDGLEAPSWIIGDSLDIRNLVSESVDFVYSCPPYGDLEVYSDNPADLSTMTYEEFIVTYRKIIHRACSRLKNNRFACFVVGEIRDKKGMYQNFVGDTINAFLDAGLNYYNEAVLLTAIGSLPVRIGRQFTAGRKLGKAHQNVLVFYKGDNHGDIKTVFNSEEEMQNED